MYQNAKEIHDLLSLSNPYKRTDEINIILINLGSPNPSPFPSRNCGFCLIRVEE